MKNFIYIIAIMYLLASLTSCTADEIRTDKAKVAADTETDTDPKIPTGGTIPPKK